MKIYVACGLSHVPRKVFGEYVSFIHALVAALNRDGATVHYALRDSDPQLAERPVSERARLCYLWDREMVQSADVVVAEATYASTGLGIELQLAEQKGAPIVICFQRERSRIDPVNYEGADRRQHTLQIGEGHVSLMALGIPTLFRVVGYATADEGVEEVRKVIELLRNREI